MRGGISHALFVNASPGPLHDVCPRQPWRLAPSAFQLQAEVTRNSHICSTLVMR